MSLSVDIKGVMHNNALQNKFARFVLWPHTDIFLKSQVNAKKRPGIGLDFQNAAAR